MLEAQVDNSSDIVQLTSLKSKVTLLQTQIEESMNTLAEIIAEIEMVEGRQD